MTDAATPETQRTGPRLGTVLGGHVSVDTFSAFVPSTLGLLEVRCDLTPGETAWLLGVGSLCSGLSQPICALISDALDSRIFGALGLCVAAICLSLIGEVDRFAELLPLFAIGAIGVGIFHPVGAATAGALAERTRIGRSRGVTAFFVAGMIGGVIGSLLAPALGSRAGGFELLRWMMVPGVAVAVALHLAVRDVPHRRSVAAGDHPVAVAWPMVVLLYVNAALRFTVNIALLYLFIRWAADRTALTSPGLAADALAEAAAPLVGRLNALTIVGMAIGGLAAGSLIRPGREKWPLAVLPLLFAPAIAAFPWVSSAGGPFLAILAAIGFASSIPVSITVAQRLLPHRTSLASGLMLGGAWAVAVVGPRLAEFGVERLGLDVTFALTALVLAVSGLILLPLSSVIVRGSVDGAGSTYNQGRTPGG